MYKLTASLALLALTQAAMAAISITNPVAGTTWKQGSKVTVAWTATGSDASGTVQITLMQGAATLLQTVETITDTAKGSSSGKFTWTVPKDTADGADYTVAFGSAPTYYYSHYFTIGKAAAGSSASGASGSAASSSTPMSTAVMSTAHPMVTSAASSGSSNSSASASAPSASASTSSGARSAAAAMAVPAVAAAVAVAALF